MFKKLCILLIFSKLKVTKLLIDKYRMHNLYAIFAKLLNICKQIAGNLVNESGNVPRRGVVPKFSDLEVVALNMASEAVGIDSESLLFAKLQEYRVEIPEIGLCWAVIDWDAHPASKDGFWNLSDEHTMYGNASYLHKFKLMPIQ